MLTNAILGLVKVFNWSWRKNWSAKI